MINISSAMGGQFAFAAAELTAEVQRLGLNPLRPGGNGARPPLDPEPSSESRR